MELTHEQLSEFLITMKRIRLFEERVANLFAEGRLPGFVHLYIGEEAVATGICAALKETDYISSTHRGHGHLIAKGGDLKKMMAELFGKNTGYCKGKGGSMHIADIDLGILGANGIVGGGLPIATGAALACQYQNNNQVAVCFFGDGASNQGTTHEAMNLAACWKLPIIYVVENNQFGEFTHQSKHQTIQDIASRATAYDIPGVIVDGNDVIAVYEAAVEAVLRARQSRGPTLLECKTYRVRGHFEGDPVSYRDEKEAQEWMARDPIKQHEARLLELGVLSSPDLEEINNKIKEELDEAVRFAEESPLPESTELLEDVYTV
jgi:pyruvate dehydrogenase E1 component alpha subunit